MTMQVIGGHAPLQNVQPKPLFYQTTLHESNKTEMNKCESSSVRWLPKPPAARMFTLIMYWKWANDSQNRYTPLIRVERWWQLPLRNDIQRTREWVAGEGWQSFSTMKKDSSWETGPICIRPKNYTTGVLAETSPKPMFWAMFCFNCSDQADKDFEGKQKKV